MGKRGPKATPPELTALEGGRSRRPPTNSPKFDKYSSIPEPPAFLGAHGRREWRRLAKMLVSRDLLTPASRNTLAAICSAYQDWMDGEEWVKRNGSTMKTPSGYEQIHPKAAIKDKARATYCSLGASFGLNPADASKLDLPKGSDDRSSIGGLLAARKRRQRG